MSGRRFSDFSGTSRLDGVGDEVLGVPVKDLRRLNELPDDVELVEILPTPPSLTMGVLWPREWLHQPQELAAPAGAYVHIRHRFCVRVRPGDVYQITTIDEFLERYRNLEAMGR